MKTLKLLLAAISLLTLTACQSPRPAPGNQLAEMIMHKNFQAVAQNYPEFASYCIQTVTRLEIEQSWANTQKMEAIKARQGGIEAFKAEYRKTMDKQNKAAQPQLPTKP